MHIRLLAVGDRQPRWVDDAFRAYSDRYPREWRFRLDTIATAKRGRKEPAARAVEAESLEILAKTAANEQCVLLDQRGRQLTSQQLASRLSGWLADGRDLVFVVGGPDGVIDTCRARADFVWSLSELTLPHGLVRVLFAEQLYRASSLLAGHPYHRE